MALQRNRSRFNMFTKDPDVLPFFSIHPRTRIGTALRVILFAFVALATLLVVLASKGLMFIWLYSLYYLIYLVPAIIISALVVLGLFKRMHTLFTKIVVPGVLAFFLISVFFTLYATMSSFYNLGISPKSVTKIDDKHSIVFMRACDSLPGDTVNENGEQVFNYRMQFNRFTARVPEAYEGETCTIEGDIMIPFGAEYKVVPEWTNDNEMRFVIASDNSGMGHGEIRVTFASGKTTPASPEATENMQFMSSQESPSGNHKVYLYNEVAYEDQTTNSYLILQEEQMVQLYTAYPCTMRFFARPNTRVEGLIRLEPFNNLRVRYEWIEDEVLVIRPADGSTGASGEITIYFNETVNAKALEDASSAIES